MTELSALITSLSCRCPRCGKGDLFHPGLGHLTLQDKCNTCGLDLKKNDSADGPAVFLIFVLGAILVPLALVFESIFSPPLWLHAFLWGGLALTITIASLKPLKSLVISIQYRHRPADWE
ncbi:MAG: DUF983 domain-containing protein [Alphaproteobacteria bacterium]|nr:DUF983 domain-containing protein [Alphaproteobacteria bacterium]